MTMSLASPDDLETIATLTAAAYRPYTELFGAPPIPVTEDCAPRIDRGEVWLREIGGETAGLVVADQHSDYLMQHRGLADLSGRRTWALDVALAGGQGAGMGHSGDTPLHKCADGAKYRALSRLRISGNGSAAEPLSASVDARRYGERD